MAARILDRNKATLGAPSGDLPGGIGREAVQDACLTVIEHGLLRRRRPRPVLGHGLSSGDVRFRPSTGPTVNRFSMSVSYPKETFDCACDALDAKSEFLPRGLSVFIR